MLKRSTEVLVLRPACRDGEVVTGTMILVWGEQLRIIARLVTSRDCIAVGREDKVIGNGVKDLGSYGVLCGWFLWVLNSPKEKGRLEPGTESPATGLKGLVRMAECTQHVQ